MRRSSIDADDPAIGRMRYRDLFREHDFTVLWFTGALSQIGDQLARIALSVLVFDRTGSGFATAATYALTYLPAFFGGLFLSGLADRFSRRRVLVGADLTRAVVFAAMGLGGLPLWAVALLLVVAVLAGSPYNAAEPAVIADIFSGSRYTAAVGLRTATTQTAQLLGFGFGGVTVALVGAREALVVDAGTFLLSALMLWFGLTERGTPAAERISGVAHLRRGVDLIRSQHSLRVLLGLAWLNGFWIVPEGLAAPYVEARSGGPVSVGLFLASAPLGNVLGAVVFTRILRAARQRSVVAPAAVCTGVPLILLAPTPPIIVALILLVVSGFWGAYLVLIVSEYVSRVPANLRGQAIGLASSGLIAAQGSGLLLGGALAVVLDAGPAIATAAGLGIAGAVYLFVARREDLGSRQI